MNRRMVIDGFSKTYAHDRLAGWVCAWPGRDHQEMTSCSNTRSSAPAAAAMGRHAALDVDMSPHIEDYRRKRDRLLAGLADDYELVIRAERSMLFRVCRGARQANSWPGDRPTSC